MIIQQKSATGSYGYYPRLLITAPTGSVVTVNGIVITGIIGETTDTYTYVCNDYGTYTVVGTLGSKSNTNVVSVDNVKDYSISISYRTYLYNEGDECTALTGGWSIGRYSTSSYTITKNSDNMVINLPAYSGLCSATTNSLIAITNSSTVHATGEILSGTVTVVGVGATSTRTAYPSTGWNAISNPSGSFELSSATLSNINMYISVQTNNGGVASKVKITKVWLE